MRNKQYFQEIPLTSHDAHGYYIFYEVNELTYQEKVDLWQVANEGIPSKEWMYDHSYSAYSVFIKPAQWGYNGVVEAIIREKYSQDEMEAITNNMAAITAAFLQTLVTDGIIAATKYLKDSINDDNTKRFKEMQEWRAMAKKVASEIIKE
jgi:hypothetical protein